MGNLLVDDDGPSVFTIGISTDRGNAEGLYGAPAAVSGSANTYSALPVCGW